MDATIVTAINTAVSGIADDVSGLVVTNLPIVLGVTAAFIGLGLAKRFLRKASS